MELRLYMLLTIVLANQLRVKSDYVRTHAAVVAMAASMQLITTRTGPGQYGQSWRITTKGLTFINQQRDNA